MNLVGQPSGGVGHTASGAARAKAALLAGKGHDTALAAVLTANPQEAEGQNPAFQVGPKLAFHVRRELPVGGSRALQKGLQVFGHHLVKGFRLGCPEAVAALAGKD
jgi:hypothetical protein